MAALAIATESCANAFTVDVEEWFHICGVGGALAPQHWPSLPSRVIQTTRLLLDELEDARVRGTFFVLGWVADRHPELVDEIQRAGHEIGSHGHVHARAYDLGEEAFVHDLRQSVSALRAAGVEEVRGFRAPEWSINGRSMWALDLLVRNGFTVDASMAPLKLVGQVDFPRAPHMRRTPSGAILEVPPLVADRFGQVMPLGWGWGLRMSSPARVLRAIERQNRAGIPAVVTVHPWELDPDPPRVSLPLRLWFAHYFRLGDFRSRLRTVLRSASFGAIGDLAVARGAR
jgi:polysaccharide deacetylase family protein (PEP-CTERM system associated)